MVGGSRGGRAGGARGLVSDAGRRRSGCAAGSGEDNRAGEWLAQT